MKYPGLKHQPDAGGKQGRLLQEIRRLLRTQFGRPAGFLGNIAGLIMAYRPSNLDRIKWTLSLLDVKPHDRVLEVGFGPGVSIELLSKLAPKGLVAGIDHSEEMVRHATRRNAEAIRAGRVVLRRASASAPPKFDDLFDKVFTINAIHFWEDPVGCLARLRGLLRPGGVMAVTLQPRTCTATDETTAILGAEIAAKLEAAGFSRCDVQMRKSPSGSAVCVLAAN
jgi:SAM-dependent methyltransferase